MSVKGLNIGFAVTGSFCTLEQTMPYIKTLIDEGAKVMPIMSPTAFQNDTKFGKAEFWRKTMEQITSNKIITTIADAEPIGPQKILDILIIAPCTGNTLAKLANGITDTAVLMATKAQLRNERPVVIAISTNDGLSMNARNLGILLNSRNIYLVPFGQDNPKSKARSIVAHFPFIKDTVLEALEGRQIQPILMQHK
ncbi:MAG: dipicolinate synthase subunit B [Desulfitibacter sp. BRH_c19]|nr:MAG: dipicolinate synthase subunit B [Desulfitibacter sp. BRH_c19]